MLPRLIRIDRCVVLDVVLLSRKHGVHILGIDIAFQYFINVVTPF